MSLIKLYDLTQAHLKEKNQTEKFHKELISRYQKTIEQLQARLNENVRKTIKLFCKIKNTILPIFGILSFKKISRTGFDNQDNAAHSNIHIITNQNSVAEENKKRCPNFERCQGKGNKSDGSAGSHHLVLSSCPLLDASINLNHEQEKTRVITSLP